MSCPTHPDVSLLNSEYMLQTLRPPTLQQCDKLVLTTAPTYIPYSTYYKPTVYYKPCTPFFSSKFLYRYRMLIYGIFVYKLITYSYISSLRIISPPLFRADVKEITHGLIIRTIRYLCPYSIVCLACTLDLSHGRSSLLILISVRG